MNAENENIAIVRKMYEHFNEHHWENMAALYAETADFKDPSFGQDIVQQTREQTAQKYREMGEIFPDLYDEIIAIYPSGEQHVIVEFVSSATTPDGNKWTLPICTIFSIENGLIAKDFTYYDRS